MTKPVVLRAAARREFAKAALWYEKQRAGLGAAFSAAVNSVLISLPSEYLRFAVVEADVRQARVTGFPYCVYFRVFPTRITVIAVFHHSRNPDVWKRRIR